MNASLCLVFQRCVILSTIVCILLFLGQCTGSTPSPLDSSEHTVVPEHTREKKESTSTSKKWSAVRHIKTDSAGLSPILDVQLKTGVESIFLHFVEDMKDANSGDRACYIVQYLRDANRRIWIDSLKAKRDYVSFCRTCSIRATVGFSEATLLISKKAYPTFATQSLSVQLLALDCITGAPLERSKRVTLYVTAHHRLPQKPTLRIVLYSPKSLHRQLSLTQKLASQFQDGLKMFASTFQKAGIRLHTVSKKVLPVSVGHQLTLQQNDWSNADVFLKQHTDVSSLPIFLLSCLKKKNVLIPHRKPREIGGIVSHLPGPLVGQGHRAGVFLSVGLCQTSAPVYDLKGWGRLLIHEVGHYLGLPHTIEADGYRDPTTFQNKKDIMESNYLSHSSSTFSQKQIKIILAHPLLYSDTDSE